MLARTPGASSAGNRPRPTAMAMGLLLLFSGCARFVRNGDAVSAYHHGEFGHSSTLFRQAIANGDHDPHTLYNFGSALVGADSTASAIDVLGRLTSDVDPDIRFRSLFNLGLAQLNHGSNKTDTTDVNASLDAALAMYKKALLMRPHDMDAKWNYELALRKKDESNGGGGGSANQSPAPQPKPQPSGGLAQRQAEQLLGSAAREERDVQAQKQKQNKIEPPPGGKSW